MKTEKFAKKLSLNKKTIADLGNGEMKVIQGGKENTVPWSNCYLCYTAPWTNCDAICPT